MAASTVSPAARRRAPAKPADRPAVETASIATLLAEHARFDRLDDPEGYLRGGVRAWAETLVANPAAEPTDPALSLATVGNRVVGRLGFVASLIERRGISERALSLDGFYVSEGYKSTGVGATLLLSALETRRGLIASGAPSPEAKGLYERVGFKERGPLRRLVYLNRLEPLATRVLGNGTLSSLVSTAAGPLLGAYGLLLTGWMKRGSHFQVVEKDGLAEWATSSSEEARETVEGRFPVSSEHWKWVATRRQLRRVELHDTRGLAAWGVLGRSQMRLSGEASPPLQTARLLDYEAHDDAARRVLIAHFIEYARREKLDLLEMQVGDPEMARLGRRCGMIAKGGNCVMYRPAKKDRGDTSLSWRLRLAAGDVLINF